MGTTTETLRLIVEASTKGASSGFQQVAKDAEKTDESVSKLKQSGAGIGSALSEGLKTGLIGAGVVASLTGLINKFTEGALGAEQLGKSLNSTTGDASKFAAKLDTVGLGTKDLIEIQAEFQNATTKNKDALSDLGVEYSTNAEGQVDWQATLVDTLDAMDGVGDASDRNQKMVALFGEEGSKQLSGLVTDGQSLKQTLEEMPELYTDTDADNARKLTEAMAEVQGSATRLGAGLASMLVGPLTTVMDLFSGLLDLFQQMPAGMQAASIGVAALALKFGDVGAGWKTFKEAMETESILAQVTKLETTGSQKLGAFGTAVAGAKGVAKGFGKSVVAGLGGPLPAAMIGLTLAWGAVQSGIEAADQEIPKWAGHFQQAVQDGASSTDAMAESAQGLRDSWGFWEGFSKSIMNPFKDATTIAQEDLQAYQEEMGIAAVKTAMYQATQKSLADTIAGGVTSGQEFTDAVNAQGAAMVTQANNSAISSSAMDAYKAATIGAVDAVIALTNSQLGNEASMYSMQQAVFTVSQTVDDAKTPWNEIDVAQNRAMQSVMSYAQSTADMAAQNAVNAGQVSDAWGQASSKADAYIGALKESMQAPGMTAEMQADIQRVIDKITEAKATGDIEVLASLTGGDQVATETDALGGTKEEATVPVVTSNADKVKAEITGLGTFKYPDATIKVVSTGVPEVAAALNGLAQARYTANVNVQVNGVASAEATLNNLARTRTSSINATQTITQVTIPAPTPPPAALAATMASSPPSAEVLADRYAGGYTMPPVAAMRASAPSVVVHVSDRLADYIDLQVRNGNDRLTRAVRTYAAQGTGGGMR